jgi:glycosyltransferase involved in cell wall biosynthesis
MRILHVHSGNLYGGVETVLTTLARRRDDCLKLQQQFALCFEGRLSSELASLGAPAHFIGPVHASRPLTLFRGRHELRKLLLNRVCQALVFHSAWSYALFASVARAARLPAVVWMHGTTAGKHWTERWAGRTDPDLVVCNSRFTAEAAAAVYPYAPKRVLYCPVELDSTASSSSDRETIRAKFNTPGSAVVIVQVSRAERWKGQLLHLEALSRLKSIPDWVCWFVGGPQRREEEKFFNEIRNEAVRHGITERVRFLNERSDVPSLLRAADIYCQPNLQPEPFGITLVEALNASLPVVATRMGGATEIVDDTCGMLVRPNSAEEIAARLRQLIEQPALRRRFGQAGPARATELCDPAARIKDFFSMLTNVLTGISLRGIHP